MPKVEKLLVAGEESVVDVAAMLVGIEENGHCCCCCFPSFEDSVGDRYASVFQFPSLMHLDELRNSKTTPTISISRGD